MKPVINSDGVTWLQNERCFTNYLESELPWELKIGMSKIYRDAIMGSSKRAENEQDSTKRWNTGWYLYINPFSDRNEKVNMYKGHVSLSFAFLSPDHDMKNILVRESIDEAFDDLNERHLCHVINYVCRESDKFLMNNINAINLFNYRKVEEINASSKYKAARAKRIGNKTLKPYQNRKVSEKVVENDEISRGKKRRANDFQKLLNNRIIDDDSDEEADDKNDDDDDIVLNTSTNQDDGVN